MSKFNIEDLNVTEELSKDEASSIVGGGFWRGLIDTVSGSVIETYDFVTSVFD